MESIIQVESATKQFGPVVALRGASIEIDAGSVVGLVGHNGAGKSTLVNILAGNIRPDSGAVAIKAHPVPKDTTPKLMRAMGVSCVFQELSLCPNLDVAENTRVIHRRLRGLGWRAQAERLISSKLDEIFPGHGIDIRSKVGDMPIVRQQMVEVARALTVADEPLALVILDEPTSALGDETARQLLTYVNKAKQAGLSFMMITHRLNEIYEIADKIAVMKDGAVVAIKSADALPKDQLVELMGGVTEGENSAGTERFIDPEAKVMVNLEGSVPIKARAGEIIGFAGLDGHGQRATLLQMALTGLGVHDKTSFVAGDRQSDGVFPVWSIAENLSISSLSSLLKGRLLSRAAEDDLAEHWRKRISIRADNIAQPITALSGGNQQKVLFARALAASAPIVLLDDPMRGVDVGTKMEVYGLIREEADRGRTFVWYSTELEELKNCDRVYVFRDGSPQRCFHGHELSQNRLVEASFQS